MRAHKACTRKQPCPFCGDVRTKNDHDPCIANLPGVMFACCGHGLETGYAMFEDGRVIRGEFDHIVDAKRGKS